MAAVGTRFFLVDDHETFRIGLRTLIESNAAYRIVAEASTVREATRQLDAVAFDVLVIDLTMPGSSGLTLVRELRRRKRREKVLVVTMHVTADVAAEAFAAGATGFASKADSAHSLLEALEAVARGQRHVATSLSIATIDEFMRRRPRRTDATGPLAALSAREREVFDLLTRGYSQDAIGKELFISAKTVDSHQTHIFAKLDVHSRFELLRFAFRHHLVSDLALAGEGESDE
jgi:two-component system, NarL family, response regulator NreC